MSHETEENTMRATIIAACTLGLVTLTGANAQTPDPVGGAANGAAIGGSIAGPVGAAVGAGIGAVGGTLAPPPDQVVTYVEREEIPSVEVHERIVVGEPLPGTVVLHTVPRYEHYRFAVVNHRRVIVDPRTRRVVKIIER
jgi:hypothetical protein